MKGVIIITAILGLSACATNINFDKSHDEVTQPAAVPAQDAMVENNQRMIEEARKDGRMERD